MNKWKKYFEKSKVLYREAKKDLEMGCYNKTISASWFAIETAIRSIILFHKRPMKAKSSALIAQF